MRGIRQIINHHPTKPNLIWPKVSLSSGPAIEAHVRRTDFRLIRFTLRTL
jgi:hypothetical protein